jgi:hypothetical protein
MCPGQVRLQKGSTVPIGLLAISVGVQRLTTKAPHVIERTSYEEAGTGPIDDSDAYSIELPGPRGKFMPKQTTRRRRTSTLDRRSLRRADGGGGSADRPKGASPFILYASIGTVALLFLGLAGGLKISLERALYQRDTVVIEKEPPPDTIGGVKVRRGIGSPNDREP